MAQEMLHQGRDEIGAACGGPGDEDQADAGAHEDAAVEGGQQKVVPGQRDYGKHREPEGQHDRGKQRVDQVAQALQTDGDQKDRDIQDKVGDGQRDAAGDQMAGVLLDDDGDTGEAARDQAGRLQHGSDGEGHQSRADDDEQIISDKGSDSCS